MESNYAEENVSTKQPKTRKEARVPDQNGDQERPGRDQSAPGERPQAADSASLLSFGLPKAARIAKRADFLRVYQQGVCIEGRFMTVFFLPSGRDLHRVGFTATKKAIGKAHDRNRAKRLLRECFRLSRVELDAIEKKCDWVINARRILLKEKLDRPLAEFREILKRAGAKL